MIWYCAKAIAGALLSLLVAALIVFVCLGSEVPMSDFPGTALAYLHWLAGMATGDMGISGASPIGALIAGRLAVTLPLIVFGGLIAGLVGIGLGALAARGGRLADAALSGLAELARAVPDFWLGMLLLIVFSATLHLLPAGGFVPWTSNPAASLLSLLQPAVALGVPLGLAFAMRLRDEIFAVRSSAPVAAAQARGVSLPHALRRHGARRIATAMLEFATPLTLSLVTGALVVEAVFFLPGMGRLLLDGAAGHDAELVRAAIFITMLILAVLWLLLRLARGLVDPRLSRQTPA